MSQECPEFQFVEMIDWKYQGNTYGLIDVQIKCSGKILWESPAVGNHDGAWDPVMDCKVGTNIGRKEMKDDYNVRTRDSNS